MGRDQRYKYKDIQLPQLRSFCLAGTEGNFTAAAAALGVRGCQAWQPTFAAPRRIAVRPTE